MIIRQMAKSETCPLRKRVQFDKTVENMSHLVGSYSDACILHIKTDTLIIDFKAKADFTGKREFTSIGEEVGDNLRNAVPVFFNNQVIVFIVQDKGHSFLHTILMIIVDIPAYFTRSSAV